MEINSDEGSELQSEKTVLVTIIAKEIPLEGGCKGCIAENSNNLCLELPVCCSSARKDSKNVIFVVKSQE